MIIVANIIYRYRDTPMGVEKASLYQILYIQDCPWGANDRVKMGKLSQMPAKEVQRGLVPTQEGRRQTQQH